MKADKVQPSLPLLPRIEKFQKLAYGLFLHWGLYSHLGRGEWGQYFLDPTKKDSYESLRDKFVGAQFDAREIARTAKAAGFRYAVLTTRHHDGFSLYDTRGLSSFDTPSSAAARDFVKEFADGCRAEDIVPFFYHTTLDWRWDSANCSDKDFQKYLEYLHASVEILCRHYGEIGGLWFDGNWSRPNSDWNEDRLYSLIRKHQPHAIIVNNTGVGHGGVTGHPEIDSVTFEQSLPLQSERHVRSKYVASEMCETINGHWGTCHLDFNFKSPATIIKHLSASRKVGANYLLNVGPSPDGTLPAYEKAVLEKVGEWLALCPGVIYEGIPVEAACSGRDFLLKVGWKFYFFVHDLTRKYEGPLLLPKDGAGLRSIHGFPARIQSIRWMDDNRALRFVQSDDHLTVTIDCDGYVCGEDLVVRVAEITAIPNEAPRE